MWQNNCAFSSLEAAPGDNEPTPKGGLVLSSKDD
jgi:hypothetical protein